MKENQEVGAKKIYRIEPRDCITCDYQNLSLRPQPVNQPQLKVAL